MATRPPAPTAAIRPTDCIREGWELIKDEYALFLGMALVAVLIAGAVPFSLLTGPMLGGLFFCYFARMRGEKVVFAQLFKGMDFFTQTLPFSLVLLGVSLVVSMALFIPGWIAMVVLIIGTNGANQGGEGAPVLFFLIFTMLGALVMFAMFLLTALLGTLHQLGYPLIMERKMPWADALALAWATLWANRWGLLGLAALNLLLSFAGLVCCYVGAILYLPISFASYAIAYRRLFPDPTLPPTLPPV